MNGDARLLDALTSAVGVDHVLIGTQADGYTTDWTGRWGGPALAVVRPADTRQVRQAVLACGAAGASLIAQGGNTGLVGASVPRSASSDHPGARGDRPAVVMSLQRIDGVGDVDSASRQIAVGAGATLSAVDAAAARSGLAVGVDLASRDSATIGGMVATNAGGVHVVAHGMMRAQVRGLEAVLADGSVIRRMHGLPKDNAGLDLPQLLVGSEGTLGIITEVLLGLVPRPVSLTVVVVAVASVQQAIDRLPALRALGDLHAVEFMSTAGVHLVAEHLAADPPLPLAVGGGLLLVEWAPRSADGLDLDALAAAIAGHQSLLAQDAADARRMWAWRERHTEALAAHGVTVKLDLTVPLGRAAAFMADIDQLCMDAADMRAIVFGHLAEGTLHVNLLGHVAEGAEASVLQRCADHGGSIAAEHGVGVAKAPWLHLTRSPAEIQAMRRIKDALDPDGLLNPGVILAAQP